ncbi:hypothetical protein CSAL01_13302 [Colletotrichum salicis]|uniref:Uncharacterized protein n=1 Tax=Colletotrichum salicis TaxID=1209931 RepID=A0A135UMS9_9PEZI|nr:hypothetical protein CSAL01_13302 [Colletotrichum salicis]
MIDKHPIFGVSTENPQEPQPPTRLQDEVDYSTPDSLRGRPHVPTHETKFQSCPQNLTHHLHVFWLPDDKHIFSPASDALNNRLRRRIAEPWVIDMIMDGPMLLAAARAPARTTLGQVGTITFTPFRRSESSAGQMPEDHEHDSRLTRPTNQQIRLLEMM